MTAGTVWVALFGILLTFIMGVVVWAVAGPVLSIVIFAAAIFLFVWLPRRARTQKSPPHH